MEPSLLSLISLQICNLWCKLASLGRNVVQKIGRLGSLFCWHYSSNSGKTYVLRKCQSGTTLHFQGTPNTETHPVTQLH